MEVPRLVLPLVSASLPIYMVAALTVCPTLRAGGLRIDSRALGPYVVAQTMGDSKLSANGYPPFPGERPSSEQVLKWLDEVTPHTSSHV